MPMKERKINKAEKQQAAGTERPGKRKCPIIILILLLLVTGGGYFAYVSDLLDPYIRDYGIAIPLHHREEDAINGDPKPETDAGSTLPISQKEHSDPALMNGTWISAEDNPHYWEFTFDAPQVRTDKEDVTGMIEESDDERFQYRVVIISCEGQTVYYLDRIDDDNAWLWIPGSSGLYKGHVKLHRGESGTEVIGASSKTDTGSKPSNSSVPSDPSHPEMPDDPSVPSDSDPCEEQQGHWEYIQVLVSEAWDEQVLVSAGYWEEELVSEAWDEEITYCAITGYDQVQVYVCNQCGAVFHSGNEANQHIANSAGCGGWHNEYQNEGEEHCLSYDSYTKHHDAVYRNIWHDPVYSTVHHDAVYRTEKVWVSDSCVHSLTYVIMYAMLTMQEGNDMTLINATNARKNLYQLINDVNRNSTPITITNKNGNAVLISESDWNAIQETLYLYSVPGLVESILAADSENIGDMEKYDPNEEW